MINATVLIIPCCSQESKRDHHLPPIDVEAANEEANIDT